MTPLQSLDLHQAAHAHLCSALLRIKTIAESPKLPDDIKAGIAKPDLTEDEKLALHNVTSALSNRPEVRDVVDKAIAGTCKALGIPVPERKGKGKKTDKPATEDTKEPAPKKLKVDKPETKPEKAPAPKKDPQPYEDPQDEEVDVDEEERSIAQLDVLLASSSGSEGSGSEAEAEGGGRQALKAKKAARRKRTPIDTDPTIRNTALNSLRRPNTDDLDPMEITEDEDDADSEDNSDLDVDSDLDPMEVTDDEDASDAAAGLNPMEITDDSDDSEDDENGASSATSFQGFSEASDASDASDSSDSKSPPPKKKKPSTAKPPPTQPGTSTFLPSLMGGYFSNSDSEASDIDIAPPLKKNRRGQRARQAIWEKKFKAEAKHLKKQQQGGGKGGRDAGWDMKRGAVGAGDGKPWKRGIRNPLSASAETTGANMEAVAERKPKVPKRDDTGTLHPSWEAKKKAKEAQGIVAFQGKKTTFD